MDYTLLIYLVLLFTSVLAYFWIAGKLGMAVKSDDRNIDSYFAVRGGGIIFVVGVILYYLLFGFSYSWFFAGLMAIAMLSFTDDVLGVIRGSSGVPSGVRIAVHFGAILMMFVDCGFYALPWYWVVAALVVGAGVINTYNFMDGINGITGGYSLVVVAALWFINRYGADGTGIGFVDENLLYTLAMALLVFNYFNFRPKARCFAGDIGSVSIAFILLFLLGRLINQTDNFTYISLLMVYGVDTVLTILYRIYLRENIFEAHRKHLYQLLANEKGLPHPVVSLIYMSVQAIISIIFISTPTWWTFLALALPTGCTWLFLRLTLKITPTH
jgi:UDP-N-acetylmuramyl pentapeptide phosphotransferase/UDP-N-acetylglucosamine-1-phosphate transferase